jgi:hypothetical protein
MDDKAARFFGNARGKKGQPDSHCSPVEASGYRREPIFDEGCPC